MNKLAGLGVASAALALVFVTGAKAESFTFSGTSKTDDQVTTTMEGRPAGGTIGSSVGTTTMASGKVLHAKSHCANWTTEPGGFMTTTGVCTGSDETGAWTIGFSCQTDFKANTSDCWGKIYGADSGGYAKKTGEVAWHSAPSADKKSGMYSGTGMWN